MIANISPCLSALGDTTMTLDFAKSIKLIKNPIISIEENSENLYILRAEIEKLKAQLNLAHELKICQKCNNALESIEKQEILNIKEEATELRQEYSNLFVKQQLEQENYVEGLKMFVQKLKEKIENQEIVNEIKDAVIYSLEMNNPNTNERIELLKKEI